MKKNIYLYYENFFINPMLQVGSGFGSGSNEKSNGSGSSSLAESHVTKKVEGLYVKFLLGKRL